MKRPADKMASCRAVRPCSWALAYVLVALCAGIGRADATTPEKPPRGGTLRLAFASDWRSLDPIIAFDGDSLPLQRLLFRGLVDFDEGTGLVPDQAADWGISPDGKTYTFHLRPGVRFSDGREVEAEDYVFSFERVLDPNSASQSQIYFVDIQGAREFRDGKAAHVSGLRAPDRRTFVIELNEPVYTFRYVLAMCAASVVPRDLVKKYGNDFQYHMAGTGPYRIALWRRGISYRLERNPYYVGADSFVDQVDIRIGPDHTLSTMMLERGEIDLAAPTPPDYVRLRRDPRRQASLRRIDLASTDYFFMNTELKPFDDARVRHAASEAVDIGRLLTLVRGYGIRAQGIIPPSMPWSNPDVPPHEHDPAKARKLLADAGLPGGFKTQLWFPMESPIRNRLAQGVQQDLHEVGIEVELKPVTSETFVVKAGARRQVPCGVSAWGEDYPDPSDFLDILFNGRKITEADCNNIAFYGNPDVTALIERAGASMDGPLRTRLFQQAERIVMGDAPWVPILHEQLPVLINPRLHGFKAHPVYGWRYEGMWLDK